MPVHRPTWRAVVGVVLALCAIAGAPARAADAPPPDASAAARERVAGMTKTFAALYTQGRYVEAVAVGRQALATARATLPANDGAVSACAANLAAALQSLGELAEAERLLREALAVREAVDGPDGPEVANLVQNLGMLLKARGLVAEARALVERALGVLQRVRGPDHPQVLTVTENLAGLLAALDERARAAELYEQVLARREALAPGQPWLVRTLVNLGALRRSGGDLAGARASYERAIAIGEATLGPDHLFVAVARNNLAAVHFARGEGLEARRLLERALAARERALGGDHPDVAQACSNLAIVLATLGDTAGAAALHERALRIHRTGLAARSAGLNTRQRLVASAALRAQLGRWVTFAPTVGRSGYEEVLALRGAVARQETVDRRLARTVSPADASSEAALREAEARVARVANDLAPTLDVEARGRWQRRYAEAAATRAELLRARAERVALAAPELATAPATVDDLRAALADDEALVELFRTRDAYVAWIVRRDGPVERVELGAADAVDAAAATFTNAVADEDDVVAPGVALRRLVWSPIAGKLGRRTTRIVLCPDAALAAVPFAALPGSAPGSWWLDDFHVTTVFQGADLVRRGDTRAIGSSALVVGGVDYERADAGPSGAAQPSRVPEVPDRGRPPAGGAYPPLPGTAREADDVRDRLGRASTTLLSGPSASEARFREALRGRGVVHVATHGFAREDLRTGLARRRIADPWTSAELEQQLAADHDPMLLAGLALAGANRREGGGGDDGILTALEASYLDLDTVDLVTLSACETARGTVEAGEGVMGLVSAFRMAGARRVIASLWKVDDEATRLLMGGVYARMLRKEHPLSAADALREAALALRAWKDPAGTIPFAAPRHWAAFVAYGR